MHRLSKWHKPQVVDTMIINLSLPDHGSLILFLGFMDDFREVFDVASARNKFVYKTIGLNFFAIGFLNVHAPIKVFLLLDGIINI